MLILMTFSDFDATEGNSVSQTLYISLFQTYKDEGGEALLYDVHFWIGMYSTQVKCTWIRG